MATDRDDLASAPPHDPETLARILDRARAASGIDFRSYRRTVMARRVHHRAIATACGSLEEYVRRLDVDADEVTRLIDALLIKTTELFREPRTLELLREALPVLVEQRTAQGHSQLRAWVAGCSTGEEAFSIAVVIQSVISSLEHPQSVRVFASDADPSALDQARRGLVPPRLGTPTIPAYARRFFTSCPPGLAVAEDIRAITTFSFHDLLDELPAPNDAVFASFDVVSCRNVLIYLEEPHRRRVVERLASALESGGLLLLGDAESTPSEESTGLRRLSPGVPLYTKS